MPRSQKANRRRATLTKIKQKPKGIGKAVGKRIERSQRFQNSSLSYDEKATQFSNYERLGLMADANQIGVTAQTITGFNPRVKLANRRSSVAAAAEGASSSTAAHPLELEVPEGLKTIRQVPTGEFQVLLKLEAAHGSDYGAMARDMRLNKMQHTAAWLRKRIAKMHAEEEEEQAAAAEAEAAGASARAPRHKPKTTKHPNEAFSKRSKHFL